MLYLASLLQLPLLFIGRETPTLSTWLISHDDSARVTRRPAQRALHPLVSCICKVVLVRIVLVDFIPCSSFSLGSARGLPDRVTFYVLTVEGDSYPPNV